MGRIRLPDTEKALLFYYKYTELGNEEIKQLFGITSANTIVRIKKEVKIKMVEQGVRTWIPENISTRVAFEVWGIDIQKLERDYSKMKKLGFINEPE